MSNRNLKHSLRSTLASLALASSLTGVVAACSADTPTVTQVPSTISAQVPETAAPVAEGLSFYYDGVKTSVTIKDAAVLFAACSLNTGDAAKIVSFVNTTLKAGPITASDVTGLGDPLKPAISDFNGNGVVNCEDAAILFAVSTVGVDAAKVNAFVSGTLKIPGVSVTQTQLDTFFKTPPTPTPTPTSTPTPTPTPTPSIVVTPSSLTLPALSTATLDIKPNVAPEGGKLVLSVVSTDSTIASIAGSSTLTFPVGSTSAQQVTVSGAATGTASIVVTVAGTSEATNYAGVPPVTVPVKVEPPLEAGLVVKPTEVSAQVGSTVTFSVAPTQPPLNGNLVVSVVSDKPTVATVNLPTLTFPEGNTAPQVVTVTGVGVGESTITIGRAATTTATNYPTTIASKTVKATITAGPSVAPKTIFVLPSAPATGDGSSPLTPASFANAFTAAKTLQQATPNLPVILKVVGVGAPENLAGVTEVKAINNGTITIQPEPAAAGGLAEVQLAGNFTIGSAVTVNDIKINLNGQQLTIEGNASKLRVVDTGATNETVTVAAGASVTDSTIKLSNNAGDQLIVKGKGILKNSTVVATTSPAGASIIKLAGELDGVTFSCKINAAGVCIEATAAGAQIINSKVDFETTAGGAKVVDTGTNGVTIIGSDLKRIPANSTTTVTVVNHGGGALVVQNSTIDLNNTTGTPSRAVNSTATSGSIILTGNIFSGYNKPNEPVVEIAAPPGLGATPQQIANNQFLLTINNAIGIKSNGAPLTLINQYATGSGNTFGSSTTPVTN
ncbi:hypothetical protein [Synechococcus sp. W55.2]|uniref:hypothetical protein n=1 Tax=Synechococcus sp. W55.2 TaxID=2964513 RepID=UPI0039C22617